MSKYGVFLPRSGPQSLVDPIGKDSSDEIRLRRDGPTFDEILEGQLPSGMLKVNDEVKASLKLHNIELSPLELDTIASAVDRLADAGRKRGLIMSDRGAFVVDVTSREIELALPRDGLRSELIEGIDSFIGV